jgi:hypothetical protein
MVIRAMMVQPMKTSIPKDSITNSWHVKVRAGTAFTQSIAQSFIDGVKPVYESVANYRSADMQPSAAHWVFYDLSQPKPRAPLFDLTAGFTLTQQTNTLPHEVSLCVSFQAPRFSGLPQARRRGRLYIGPWSVASNDGLLGRPAAGLRTGLTTALQTFLTLSKNAGTLWEWLVYSPTGDAAGAATPFAAVDNGWVDDEWDIQRRRGLLPTTRSTFQ